jgi:glucan phosphoethanolaminetransferase (alkaline phosphatase superfamily)
MFFSNHNYRNKKEDAGMEFPMMAWYYMRFKKASKGFTCRVCETQCQKGMHYIGDNYVKTCMRCAPIYMNNTIKEFQKWMKYIKANVKICKENEDKWIKEALVGSLEQGNT